MRLFAWLAIVYISVVVIAVAFGLMLRLKLKPTRQELWTTLLVLIGIATTILFVMGAVSFWRTEYGLGSIFFALGAGLAFAFFRRNMTGLILIGLIWIMVNAGLTGIFHPTVLGILVTVGSGALIVLVVKWKASRS